MTSPIPCREVEARLSEILAGEREGADAQLLNEHLAGCRSCENRAAKFFLQHRALAELAAERSLEEILNRVRARLPAPRKYFRKFALAAACLLAAAGVFFLIRPRSYRVEVPTTTAEMKPPEAPLPEKEAREAPPQQVAELPETPPLETQKTVGEAAKKPTIAPRPDKRPPQPTVRKQPEPPALKPEAPVEKLVVQEPPPSPSTVAAVATFEEVSGDVNAVGKTGPKRSQVGQPLAEGSGIQTVGPLSFARLKFADGTILDVWGDTAVREVVEGQGLGRGKRVFVEKGTVVADVVKQPLGRSMIIATPQGEARVLGTTLRLIVDGEASGATILEVEKGLVDLKRVLDGRSVTVASGHFAVAAVGVELRPMLQGDRDKAKQPPLLPDADQKKVDEAIKKGISFLRTQIANGRVKEGNNELSSEELFLFTFLHAGVPENDPDFQSLFKTMMETEPKRTYKVALQAMILEEMHRVKYQWRIAQCAQFLVDNQAKNGQWVYGTPSQMATSMPTGDSRPEIATGSSKTPVKPDPSRPVNQREKPKVLKRIVVTKAREGSPHGDPSNSQYAALGLRACHDAGIVLPADVIKLADKAWRRGQEKDGGWRYGGNPAATGSMTAGATGSLLVYHYILNEPWMKDEAVLSGLEWLNQNYSVSWNPGMPDVGPNNTGANYYYYLYALERLGVFYPTETIGTHKWYPEGVRVLLEAQRGDGVWVCKGVGTNNLADTSFAILFLRRATRPLLDVASVDRYFKQK